MSGTRKKRVVVVGAGIAGSLIATGLMDHPKIDLVCLERVGQDDHAEAGTGLNIGPNALKCLRAHLPERADTPISNRLPWRRWTIALTNGRSLMDLALSDVADNDGIRIRWAELYALLRAPLANRIGFFARIGDSPVDAAISHAAAHFAERLAAQGCAVQAIDAPFDAARSAAAWGTVTTMGLAWRLASRPGWEERATPNTRTLAQAGMARPTGDYLDAVAAAAVCRREAAQIFGDWDFLLCPAMAAPAWPAGEAFPTEIDGRAAGPRDHAVFTGWMNVAGVPALSMPIATSSDGGGIGMQLVAAAGRGLELLEAAATLLAS